MYFVIIKCFLGSFKELIYMCNDLYFFNILMDMFVIDVI